MYLVNAVWLFAQVGIVHASLMLIHVCGDKCHQGDLDTNADVKDGKFSDIDDSDDIVTPNADPERS